jgi:hypothetical protein
MMSLGVRQPDVGGLHKMSFANRIAANGSPQARPQG